MEEKLRQIVAKITETSPDFPVDSDLRDDLRVDSIRGLEIVFEIERTFGVKVPDDRYNEVQTFGDMLALLKELKGE
jgi:acyl carrier protein